MTAKMQRNKDDAHKVAVAAAAIVLVVRGIAVVAWQQLRSVAV